MTKIKLNNVEVDKAELVKLYKEKPELFKEEEKPLGDDFNMLEYFRILKGSVRDSTSIILYSYEMRTKIEARLNALIKIWEWKEKNDGEFGVDEVIDSKVTKYTVYYVLASNKFYIMDWYVTMENTETPSFSSRKIADRAIKELEQEYKIVFNVK